MLRRFLLAAVIVVLAACSDCGASCKEGISFYVSDAAGALAPGRKEDLQICFDGACKTTTLSRSNVGGTVFLAFSGVGKSGDHTITLTSTGALKGTYTGPLTTYTQTTKGSCTSKCPVAAVKIGADGSLTPGKPAVPVVASTTTAHA